MKIKYTELDLKKLKKEYEENFIKLSATVGRKEHKKYLKIENLLTKKNTQILKDLGGNWKSNNDDIILNPKSIFALATRQLLFEERKGLRRTFTALDIFKYARKIRNWEDIYGKKGLETARILGKVEHRSRKFLRLGK